MAALDFWEKDKLGLSSPIPSQFKNVLYKKAIAPSISQNDQLLEQMAYDL